MNFVRANYDSSGSQVLDPNDLHPADANSVVTTMDLAGGNGAIYAGSNMTSCGIMQNAYNDGSWRYKIGGNPAILYQQQAGTHAWYTAAAGVAGAVISWTTVMAVDKDKTLTLQGGVQSAGCGIAFPATQVASADANTLDDYEEGTFTPTITFGGAAVGVTYSIQLGRYTKVGNRVHINAYVALTNKGSSVGAAVIGSLPFTVSSVANNYQAITYRANSMAAGIAAVQAYAATSTTTIIMEKFAAGASGALVDTDVTNTSIFLLTGTYEV